MQDEMIKFNPEQTDMSTLINYAREQFNKKFEQNTPSWNIKSRDDGFNYVEYADMMKERNEKFPLHSDEWFGPGIIFSGEFVIALVMSHVVTEGGFKISTPGCDAKRLTFKKNSEHIPANVIDLGNDVKSVMSEALKKAWSNFGVCPNVYMTNVCTFEQHSDFMVLKNKMQELKFSPDIVNKTIEAWKTQNVNTASQFLTKLKTKIEEKQNEQQ